MLTTVLKVSDWGVLNFLAIVSDPKCFSRLIHSSWEKLEFTTRLRISTLTEDMSQLNSDWSYLFQAVKGGFSCDSSVRFSASWIRNRCGQILVLLRRPSSPLAQTEERDLRFPERIVRSVEFDWIFKCKRWSRLICVWIRVWGSHGRLDWALIPS